MRSRRHSTTIAAIAMTMLSSACGAQGLSLIDHCANDVEPIDTVLPLKGAHTYRVTARFVIDVNGGVVAPSVKASQLVMASGATVPVPPTVDRSFLDALRKWRYARRPKPCLRTVDLEMLLSV
ncbi:MAG TPA: hypothetical protein VM692_08365 [Gammaproteobacteria bacterium]|nr:hypothetical protein [Gammaproteobacteria bacterium]